MMGLDERVFYFILGCIVGAIFGYLARHLQTIEARVDHVDKIIEQDRKEAGFMKLPSFNWSKLKRPSFRDLMLIVVVLMVAFAAFSSQRNSNDVKHTQSDQLKVGYCNAEFLGKTIEALNERTTYSGSQVQANITLQKSFLEFLRILTFQPPKPQEEQERAYYKDLGLFVEIAEKAVDKQVKNPYPTVDQFTSCLDKDLDTIKKELNK